ncbi:hypothetical protein [Brevibacterium sp. FAM 27836]|uniref:hypothetical protein n=1 Tax=Brevibacterium sp. FAM 27836 TaxID=3446693 RepID=UPI003F511504
MFTPMKLAVWTLLAIGLIVNVVFFVDSGGRPYPLWALLPIIAALVLMIPILRNDRR